MIERPLAAALAAAALAGSLTVAAAGCGSKKSSAAPTPTPAPSLVVSPVITISGTTEIQRGECVAFVITTS
ncbi:MAG TPA: hypothetical protein VMV18_11960, partial [bacterium]|nr:hypothetical protein [bacterium]